MPNSRRPQEDTRPPAVPERVPSAVPERVQPRVVDAEMVGNAADAWPVVTMAWHEPTAPKRVHDAYAALREGLDVVSGLREEFQGLRAADERQERERREAHAAHLAGGPAPKAYKRAGAAPTPPRAESRTMALCWK
ncbi:hypothetical protein ABZY09_37790 [Streptomyces sp. NPDC002928]|uniref:hypothetical protein n=1 Tax=Streptomyces sp. NPDC002928 TaxID=3154440 RepID=UPI0033BD565B